MLTLEISLLNGIHEGEKVLNVEVPELSLHGEYSARDNKSILKIIRRFTPPDEIECRCNHYFKKTHIVQGKDHNSQAYECHNCAWILIPIELKVILGSGLKLGDIPEIDKLCESLGVKVENG